MSDSLQPALVKSEPVLVTEAKAGSYAAFEELVNRYEKKIYRLGMNITGSPEDAEDVLQETFLKAFEHLPDFREDSRFYTWLVRIAVNEGLMKLRKRRSSKEVPIEDSQDEEGEVMPREFADWKPNPEQLLARAELETILSNAVKVAPPNFSDGFLPAGRGRPFHRRDRGDAEPQRRRGEGQAFPRAPATARGTGENL